MNKTRSHLHIFSKINKLIHRYYKSSSSIYCNWINRVDFLYFFGSVRFVSAQLASSPPFSLPGAASPPADVTTSPCHVTPRFLPHGVKMSSLHPLHPLTMLRPVAFPSRAKTETLNMHHRRQPPSPERPTLTLHCYKKVILILITLLTTQPHLHFAYSLARAPRHRSFTRRHRFLSPPSHVHHPSAQRHPWWWTNRPFFAS
jgi:hypothetical protein